MEVPVKTRSGETFYVQVDEEAQPGPVGDANVMPEGHAMGLGGAVLDTSLFSRAVGVIREVSEEVTEGLMSTHPRPSEVELSLNLGFDASGNVWIFKGGASASLRLVLKWRLP